MTVSNAIRTPLCDLLGCQYPIVQTAMGWVAGSSLVAATSNAGGFGFLAGATIAADEVEAEIIRVKALTGDKPFGLNFHMFQPNANQLLDLAIEYKLRAVSYGRGPDKKVIGRLRDAGIVCMPTVGALKHAQKAIEMGANAITIQGGEAEAVLHVRHQLTPCRSGCRGISFQRERKTHRVAVSPQCAKRIRLEA